MRSVFLYGVDYEKNERVARVDFASKRDRATLRAVLEDSPKPNDPNANILAAQTYLDRALQAYLVGGDESAGLAKWAHFLSTGITFAIFDHPDRNAAYRVFEVVNTRGKDLTPAELIKSFVIGTSKRKSETHREWEALEQRFRDASADSQLTQFIRNVVTLRHGYVEPRDLYDAISDLYKTSQGVQRLFNELHEELPLYLQLVAPPLDRSDETLRSFSILNALGLRTVRPIFLAVARTTNASEGFEQLFRIIVPRLVAGSFGTGSIERRFAEAARDIFADQAWEASIEDLQDLRPTRNQFMERLSSRAQNKGVLLVVRSAVVQHSPVPDIEGYVHQVRPRSAEDWPGFTDEEFDQVGGTIGNFVVSDVERRPRNSNSLDGALANLLPTSSSLELDAVRNARSWTAEEVFHANQEIAIRAAALWYD